MPRSGIPREDVQFLKSKKNKFQCQSQQTHPHSLQFPKSHKPPPLAIAILIKSMSISRLFGVLLVFIFISHHSLASILVPDDIFILAGQSNMAGRGGIDNGKWNGYIPPECRSNPSILRLSAQLKWEVAHEPLHSDIDVGKTCGVGPGMAFANGVKASDSRIGVVGLVPCAVGGTKISQWARGMKLYEELISRVNESVRHGGTIRAILWYQGESNTVRKHDAESYKGKMENFIANLRSDLNILSLPVIQVALASGEGKFVEIVRRAQLGMKIPNVKCVDAKGLPLKTDHLHLTTMSQVHLGLQLAHAYILSFAHLH